MYMPLGNFEKRKLHTGKGEEAMPALGHFTDAFSEPQGEQVSGTASSQWITNFHIDC